MKVFLKERLTCGECGTTMVHNNKGDEESIRCPLKKCEVGGIEYKLPAIELTPIGGSKEVDTKPEAAIPSKTKTPAKKK